MRRDTATLSHHPAPFAERQSTGLTAFLLFTGPLAWFVQLCVGFMLVSWPCFPGSQRLTEPLAGYRWTHTAALLILVLCALLAAASGLIAWREYHNVHEEREGDVADLIHVGHGRTRFVSLWGMILGLGFAIATLVTLAGFALVPQCGS